MLAIYSYPLLSVLAISLFSFVGVFTLTLKENLVKNYVSIFVSLAVGALLGDALIHLIPEAIEKTGNITAVSLAVIGGIFIFLIIERFLHWHHHDSAEHSHSHIHPVGKMILISDGLHNFLDGIIIAASYGISIEVGLATTFAVILHEIPQEIGDFGVLIHSGFTARKALLLNFASALMSILGALSVLVLGNVVDDMSIWLVAVAAGGFIYIAMSDLIPELNKNHKATQTILQIFFAGLGIAFMIGLLFLE